MQLVFGHHEHDSFKQVQFGQAVELRECSLKIVVA